MFTVNSGYFRTCLCVGVCVCESVDSGLIVEHTVESAANRVSFEASIATTETAAAVAVNKEPFQREFHMPISLR